MLKNYIKKLKQNKTQLIIIFSLIVLYFVTHLPSLTKLPVFADESIYIRWSQLIIDDWQRYLFFPLNDGKTPLFIWMLVPFQFIFKDQLFAGRFLAVMVGLVQIFINMKIVNVLGGKFKTQILAILFTSFLPFWYFHHRMSLMDGLLTLFISISFLMLVKVSKNQTKYFLEKRTFWWLLTSGVCFGLALLTKIPAVLAIPSFYLSIFIEDQKDLDAFIKSFLRVSFSVLIGLIMFASLSFNPAFGQLFSRGGDFLFPFSEIISGTWKETLRNFPNYINYFIAYLTPGIIMLILAGLFSIKHKKLTHILFWSGVLFVLPIALMGKTVYPRYVFPSTIFFTLSALMGLESIIIGEFYKKKKIIVGVIVSLLISNILISSFNYVLLSITDSNSTPFVSSDRTQYLTEWSSGHGIKETIALIREESQDKTLAVATEGSFGTLPDGLLMYLHRTNVDNLYLEGIGYPVSGIPKFFAEKSKNFDKKWLVVNSHRMKIEIDEKFLIAEYCRPFDSPCLQIWDITEDFDSYIKD